MANGELAMLYNIEGEKARKLKLILIQNGIKIRTITKEDYSKPIGILAGVMDEEEIAKLGNVSEMMEISEEDLIQEEMMVLKGLGGKRLDLLLAAMRKAKAMVALKAVVTEHNVFWNSVQLYNEIRREHEVMSKGAVKEEE